MEQGADNNIIHRCGFNASDGIFQKFMSNRWFWWNKKLCTPCSMLRLAVYTIHMGEIDCVGLLIHLVRTKRVLNGTRLVRVFGVMGRGYYSYRFDVFVNLILVLRQLLHEYMIKDSVAIIFHCGSPFGPHPCRIFSANTLKRLMFYPLCTSELVITMVTTVVCRTADRNTLVHRWTGRKILFIK